MAALAAAAPLRAAFQPARQTGRSGRRACAARCAQQDPLLLRVARGEGAAAAAEWRRLHVGCLAAGLVSSCTNGCTLHL